MKPEGAFYAFVNIKETGMTSAEVSKKLIEGAKLFSYTVEYTPYIFERPVIEMKKDVYVPG